jgi:hypothetical protein
VEEVPPPSPPVSPLTSPAATTVRESENLDINQSGSGANNNSALSPPPPPASQLSPVVAGEAARAKESAGAERLKSKEKEDGRVASKEKREKQLSTESTASGSSARSRGSKGTRKSSVTNNKKTHSSIGYSRIIKDRSKWQPFEDQDPSVKKSSLHLIKDRVGSLFRGESSEERDVRLRLEWYKRALHVEIGSLEASLKEFEQHRLRLTCQFEEEQNTLRQRGLQSLLQLFQLQSWSRLARTLIVESMAEQSVKVLNLRHKRAFRVIELFQEELANGKDKKEGRHNLDSYRNFCLKPEDVMVKEQSFVSLSKRLIRMDKVVTSTQQSFMKRLPDLEVSGGKNRTDTLLAMTKTYAELLEKAEPSNMNSKDFIWSDLCRWRTDLQREKLEIELSFGDFVDDEREREGRLFKRWVNFILKSKSNNTEGHEKTSAKDKDAADSGGGESTSMKSTRGRRSLVGLSFSSPSSSKGNSIESPEESTPEKEVITVVSPRSVVAFIKYYATIVLAPIHGIKDELVDTLKALVGSVVYRRVHSRTYRYTSRTLHARDLHWVYKCRLARYVDPVVFGIPEVYLRGPDGGKRIDDASQSSPNNNSRDMTVERRGESSDIDADEIDEISAMLTPAAFSAKSTPTFGAPVPDSGLTCDHYGKPYARVSKLLSSLTTTVNPKEIAFILLLASKWLMLEAVNISSKTDYLGADTVFPILVLSLVHADIPNVHLVLQYLHNYGEVSDASEVSYYMTCLEAAVEYIIRLEVPEQTVATVKREIEGGKMPPHGGLDDINDETQLAQLTAGEQECKFNEKGDLEDLADWLRDQQTMEDTISILKKEGIFF